jgi:hypothetical protein
MRKAYWGVNGIWSDGYFVSTVVGVNEDIIKKYIEQQGKEDMGQAQLVLGVRQAWREAPNWCTIANPPEQESGYKITPGLIVSASNY